MRLQPDLALANRLADAAGEVLRRHFRSGFAVEHKEDFSPVTVADREAEAAMRAILEADRPRDSIAGEEYGLFQGTSSRIWALDPIDGTRAFLAGRATFGTLIALLEDGRPVIGIIDQPVAGERWVGQLGQWPGTTLNGRPVKVRECPSLASAHLATTSPAAFTAQGHAGFHRVARCVRDTLLGGDCHNYGLLAAGHLDLVIEETLKLHDWAALVPVVLGAGGVITDWQGEALVAGAQGAVIAAGDRRVHEEAMSRL
ncbi:MAG: inositol monophosphatase family protein [Sphingomonadaceae bacterium]